MNTYLDPSKQNPKLFKKKEQMKEQNFKAQAREAAFNWRNHVPVYGWTTINYPTSIQRSLREKYQEEKDKKIEEVPKDNKDKLDIDEQKNKEDEKKLNIPSNKKNKGHINPELVNEEVMKEMEVLIPIDYSENFLKNYPKNDFEFLKKQFSDYANSKKKLEFEPIVPQVFNKLISDGENKFLYQLGIKSASTYLSTMDFDKKCKFVDANLIFDEKYCTMFPKSAMLGPEPDPNFENHVKKIGDISFEENKDEVESVKNLSRLPPENITEEWVKDNLCEKVTKINFENCYWLSKDLVSKLGRLDSKLKKISLRNLDLSNYIVENIIVNCKQLEELDISNCTGLTNGLLDIIAEKGKNLISLNLCNLNNAVNDGGLIKLGYELKNLKDINLGRNNNITDKGIKGLLCHGIKLSKIDLTGCMSLTNEGIKTLLELNKDSLTDLILNFLPKSIKDEAFSNLGNCEILKNIEIMGNNSNVVDNLSKLKKLVTVNLSGCPAVDDSVVNSIIDNNGNLKILRVSNCTKLTNNILENILERPNKLMLLEINRTPSITDEKINETVEKKKPNFRIIRATNIVWSKKNLGLTIPYPSDNYEKPNIKGAKKAAPKKNDDKSPENQLMKLREEMKPKMIYEFFQPPEKPKKKKKGKK